jgi:Mn-dependent DtxR family transcriptional regulator
MNASEALGRLKRLRVPAATTADAAAVLGVSGEAASHTLRRLARSGLVTPIRKGLWALADRPDPLAPGRVRDARRTRAICRCRRRFTSTG